MYNLAGEIFPVFRCLIGEGVRETLDCLSKYIAKEDGIGLTMKNVPTGMQVFDWSVPKEWVIREAYIEDENGNHIIDITDNNLHVVGYSIPVDRWVDADELKEYIYVQENQPSVIPYITSYYKERYGFCMSKNQRDSLKSGMYHMYIDSELIDGNLTYGELILPGKSKKEIFFSTYVCHPSMANNECSGPVLMAELIRYVKKMKNRKYTYRFILIPETIGSIAYLATENHLEYMKEHVIAGFNLSCVGDNRTYSMIESRYANTLADRTLKNILKDHTNNQYTTYSFLDRGSDERQYNAPGVDLPVVCFCRSKYNTYPEYHTSADDMNFISEDGFQGSYEVMTKVIGALEYNEYYKVKTLCEPQLGKRGLYPNLSSKDNYMQTRAIKNFLAYADGKMDLIEISEWIGVSIETLIPLINDLLQSELIGI